MTPWALCRLSASLVCCLHLREHPPAAPYVLNPARLAIAGAGMDWTYSDKALGDTMGALLMRTVSLLLSIGGMLVTALLLGLVSDAISSKVDDLRKVRGSGWGRWSGSRVQGGFEGGGYGATGLGHRCLWPSRLAVCGLPNRDRVGCGSASEAWTAGRIQRSEFRTQGSGARQFERQAYSPRLRFQGLRV